MPYLPLDQRVPAEQRAFLIFFARVHLREARARRSRDPNGADLFLGWAANARRQAAAIDVRPKQAELL